MHIHAIAGRAVAALALTLSVASAASAAAAPAYPRAADYVDVSAYLQTDADIEAWYALRHGLKRDFDEICGDTFCEGDYSNIESLRYVCSVHRVSGRIGTCGWTFAASDEMVDPLGGRIAVRHEGWFCKSPIVAGTTIESLLEALGVEAPLYAALPSTTATLFDGLVDCL